ncbi:glyoxylate/hydroxypyruvate reductase A-like isoform X2 [Homarus americanus]|uniref:glyoxylate/hydroxypyruvate reductase A-like isoform X2 n=1 Tax=Homarus americanus TaxID=6706 RepID=UPI001C487254|nr:glyoxylate/hydroxypyruvate reductase A-like isoform X2 [Homarus americanus]
MHSADAAISSHVQMPQISPYHRNADGRFLKNVEEEVDLQEAQVLLADFDLLLQVTDRLPQLQWVQGTWAGVEYMVDHYKDKPKPSYPVTRMTSEHFSQLMAEYIVGWIIFHERSWLASLQYQRKSEWVQKDIIINYRSLCEMTVGILGMGKIGKEVAKSLKAFSTRVQAFTRTAPSEGDECNSVDKYWHTGELPLFLQECDYIVNIMPSTPATRGMLGSDTLEKAKKDAVFINVGRGDVISEEDLVKALDSGWISAAILDVFSKEPLPKESLLWQHPKVMVTPHTSCPSRAEDVSSAFVDNFTRYTQGLPVLNIIDWNTGY